MQPLSADVSPEFTWPPPLRGSLDSETHRTEVTDSTLIPHLPGKDLETAALRILQVFVN